MNIRRLSTGIGLGLAGLLLFLALVYVFFPVDPINRAISQKLAAQGLTIAPEGTKTFLPGIGWRNAFLSSGQGPLLDITRLAVRPHLFPLLLGRVRASLAANMAGGELSLLYGHNGPLVCTLQGDGIQLARIPFFKTVLGATAGGTLWTSGQISRSPQGPEGELKLEVRQLGYSGVKLGAFPLPDASGLQTQGMVRISGNRARLESFTLQGEGLYMRLSGELPQSAAAPLDLTLEIMPKPEFMERQKLPFLLLAKFMVSPGVYRVPIRGTLLKPQIL